MPRREAAARYGLNVEDVLMTVETAIGGMTVDRTVEGRERYTINVRYARELRDDPEKLKDLLVPLRMGGEGEVAQVPLGQVADIAIRSGPPPSTTRTAG